MQPSISLWLTLKVGRRRVCSNASDGSQSLGYSYQADLSQDGRYVAFQSAASDIVSGDTNDAADLFVHDRLTGITRRITVASDGTQTNRISNRPVLSADGRYVVFHSNATNLIAGNYIYTDRIYIHDMVSAQTNLVSMYNDGYPAAHTVHWTDISADGRYVAYATSEPIDERDTDTLFDVYVYDREGPPLTTRPVVLLPEFGVSSNWDCLLDFEGTCAGDANWGWMRDPKNGTTAAAYQALIDRFSSAGYSEANHLLRVFFYDWTQPVDQNIDDLKAAIDQTKIDSGATRVDLLGHGMGGLIARAYVQSDLFGGDVENLITLGSPHQGAARNYSAWEGGALYKLTAQETIGMAVVIEKSRLVGRHTGALSVQRAIPGLQDLLPAEGYLDVGQFELEGYLYNAQNGDALVPEETMIVRNTYLSILNTALPSLFSRAQVTTIAGSNLFTPARYFVSSPAGWLWPNWMDGEPVWARSAEFTSKAGDGLILATAARLEGAPAIELLSVEHSLLPGSEAGIERIFATLGIPLPPAGVSVAAPSQATLILILHGPAQLSITDPSGRMIGAGGATIPGAEYYSDPGASFTLIMIPSPLDGSYVAAIQGTGDGVYNFGLLDTFNSPPEYVVNPASLWDWATSQIAAGEQAVIMIPYTRATATTTTLLARTPVIQVPVRWGDTRINGLAGMSQSVEIRDAVTGQVLGSATANRSGFFVVNLEAPLGMDQRILAWANGLSSTVVTAQAYRLFAPTFFGQR